MCQTCGAVRPLERAFVQITYDVDAENRDIVEAILYGIVTWSPSKAHLGKVRQVSLSPAPSMRRLAEKEAQRPQ